MESHRFEAAMEEVANGKAVLEIEITYYARLTNLAELDKAQSSEHQEQWELKLPKTPGNAGEGTVRIRKTEIPGDKIEYTLTTKVKANAEGDQNEVTVPTTEANFRQFQVLSERGMKKDRFFFPVEGSELVWEVDMFHDTSAPGGEKKYMDWCKVDLEIPSRDVQIPTFPLAVSEIITSQYPNRPPEEEKIVRELYDDKFVARNPMGKPDLTTSPV